MAHFDLNSNSEEMVVRTLALRNRYVNQQMCSYAVWLVGLEGSSGVW